MQFEVPVCAWWTRLLVTCTCAVCALACGDVTASAPQADVDVAGQRATKSFAMPATPDTSEGAFGGTGGIGGVGAIGELARGGAGQAGVGVDRHPDSERLPSCDATSVPTPFAAVFDSELRLISHPSATGTSELSGTLAASGRGMPPEIAEAADARRAEPTWLRIEAADGSSWTVVVHEGLDDVPLPSDLAVDARLVIGGIAPYATHVLLTLQSEDRLLLAFIESSQGLSPSPALQGFTFAQGAAYCAEAWSTPGCRAVAHELDVRGSGDAGATLRAGDSARLEDLQVWSGGLTQVSGPECCSDCVGLRRVVLAVRPQW